MRTIVLRAWGTSDASPGQPALVLLERNGGGEQVIASHPDLVSNSPQFQHGVKHVDFAQLLAQDKLVDATLLEAAGDELYKRIALGAVGAEIAKLGRGCRFVLDLRTPELEALPWELLRRDDEYLFTDSHVPWSIETSVKQSKNATEAKPFELPLRVLVVIGHEPDDPKVRGDDELRVLEDTLHPCQVQMLLRVLVRPDPQDIERALEEFQPHVFHFIGHGELKNGRAVFRVFSNRRAKLSQPPNDVWDAERVTAVFKRNGAPRLVILNACEAGSPQTTSNLIQAFLKAGARFVIAMQAEIMSTAALTFSERLYEHIVQQRPLDVAVAEARHALGNLAQGNDKTQWPIARLVVKRDIEIEVLPFEPARLPKAASDFVQRWNERKTAWDGLCCTSRLLVVQGPPKTGKTELLKIMAETWSSSYGRSAIYVDFTGPFNPIHPRATFRTSPELAYVIDMIERVLTTRGIDTTAFGTIARDRPSNELGQGLREALEACAKSSPLLLLLDGFQKWDRDNVVNTLLPELCMPYANPDSSSNVRVAVALPDDMANVHWDPPPTKLHISKFPAEEWRRAAHQFIRWHRRSLSSAGTTENQLRFFDENAYSLARITPEGRLKPPLDDAYETKYFGLVRFLTGAVK